MENLSVISLKLRPSVYAVWINKSIHVLAAMSLFMTCGIYAAVILPLLYGSYLWIQKSLFEVEKITLLSDLELVLKRNSSTVSARLVANSYISSAFILLRAQPQYGRTISVPVFPDSLNNDEFFQLVSYLNTYK